MSHIVDYLSGASYFHDYSHASRLYLSNNYALLPKSGWLYYIEFNVNDKLLSNISDPTVKSNFNNWYSKSRGNVNLLAKSVDTPKFTIQTEKLNQYNRTTIIQKKIEYGDISIVFHDDAANCTTNLWKSYYQYYFGDSVGPTTLNKDSQILPKYVDTKYNSFIKQENYGLNNNQTVQFFKYIKIYQLYQGKYTSFTLVNPVIREWSHDQLDQTQGNKFLTNRMGVQYETVIYDTDENNLTRQKPIGFEKDHYDQTVSPLQPPSAAENTKLENSVYGSLTNTGGNPLDLLSGATNKQYLTKANSVQKVNLGGTTVNVTNSLPTGYQNFQSFALNNMQSSISPLGTNSLGIITPNSNSDSSPTVAEAVNVSQGNNS